MQNYLGKKILVTGHTGFKGTWLSLILKNLGAHVVGVSLEPKSNSLYTQFSENLKVESYYLDICEAEKLNSVVKEVNPDGIFHLAAQSLVLDSYQEPIKTFNTNILGTANLLNAIRDSHKISFCILATTDKVYRNDNSGKKFVEDDPLGGIDPYSASKAASEIVIESMRRSFFQESSIQIVATRAGNVIGGGDNSMNRLVPDLIRAFEEKQTCLIRHPDSIRPWQHVFEPLAGYLMIGSKILANQKVSTEYNFGPNTEKQYSVSEIASYAQKIWPTKTEIQFLKEDSSNYEASNLRLDSGRAERELKWFANIEALQAIEMTIQWELERIKGNSTTLLDFSNAQINSYFAQLINSN